MYEAFDPKKHKGKKLLELISETKDDIVASSFRPTDIDFETASETPWYYFVEVEDVDSASVEPGEHFTLSELMTEREVSQKIRNVRDLTDDLQGIITNIMSSTEADRPSLLRSAINEFIILIGEGTVTEREDEYEEAEFNESMPSLGTFTETSVPTPGLRSPVDITMQIIAPGPGNKRDNNYYPADVLRRDAHVFEGADVFITDHVESERGESTKVGIITEMVGFSDVGAPLANVTIYDPNQAEKARNRAASGMLETLECSIKARGKARVGTVAGKQYNIVEAITSAQFVDLVSKAGAGGKALNLRESNNGGESVEGQEDTNVVEEILEPVDAEAAEVAISEGDAEAEQEETFLPLVEVQAALLEARLPTVLSQLVLRGTYKTTEELAEVIANATAGFKTAVGSGKPFGVGESQQSAESVSAEDRAKSFDEALDAVDAKYNIGG